MKKKDRRDKAPAWYKLPEEEIRDVLRLYIRGNSERGIARELKTTIGSVRAIVDRHKFLLDECNKNEEYRNTRAELLTAAEAKLLKSVSDDGAIAKAPLSQRSGALDAVSKLRRLEEGKSTSNQAIEVRRFVEVDLSRAKEAPRSITNPLES